MTHAPGRAGSLSIADTVLAAARPRARPRAPLWLAFAVGLGVHVAVIAAASRLHQEKHARAPAAAPRTLDVSIDEPLDPPAPPPPPPPAAAHEVVRASSVHHAAKAAPTPVPPARAASVITRAEPETPVDFGTESFVVGAAAAYVGGATATSGTSTQPATRSVPPPPSAATGDGPRLSRPVMLDADEWQCPWPSEAELTETARQTVTMRVRVAADGHAQRVTIMEDPGHGFAAAARHCALATHFTPARDPSGHATDADSPPIRVRFIR